MQVPIHRLNFECALLCVERSESKFADAQELSAKATLILSVSPTLP
jgi:hypothetical protein